MNFRGSFKCITVISEIQETMPAIHAPSLINVNTQKYADSITLT